jgi:carbamoyltransferase
MVVVGIGYVDHEASVALVVDGELRNAIAKERLSRIKHDGRSWGQKRLDVSSPILYCLNANGLSLHDVDLVVWSHIGHAPEADVLEALMSEQNLDISNIPRIVLPHHFAHACGAFHLSPFSEAAVLVVDGSGGPLDGLMEFCEGPERGALVNGGVIVQNLSGTRAPYSREHESF